MPAVLGLLSLSCLGAAEVAAALVLAGAAEVAMALEDFEDELETGSAKSTLFRLWPVRTTQRRLGPPPVASQHACIDNGKKVAYTSGL